MKIGLQAKSKTKTKVKAKTVGEPFQAKTDPTHKVLSMAVMIVGLVLVGAYMFLQDIAFGDAGKWVYLSIVALVFIGFSDEILLPQRYVLGKRAITVERKLWKTTIPMSLVTRVEFLDRKEKIRSLPILGWKSFTGANGLFLVNQKDVWTFHSHRQDRIVVLHTLKGVIAITPEPATRFVSQAQDLLKIRPLGRSS